MPIKLIRVSLSVSEIFVPEKNIIIDFTITPEPVAHSGGRRRQPIIFSPKLHVIEKKWGVTCPLDPPMRTEDNLYMNCKSFRNVHSHEMTLFCVSDEVFALYQRLNRPVVDLQPRLLGGGGGG